MRKYLLSALGLTAFIVLMLSPLSAYAAPLKGVKPPSQPFHSPTLSVAQKHHPHFYIRNHPRQPRSAAPADTTIPYQGGPVMGGNVMVFTIFWQPSGSQVDPNYNSLINQFFNDFSQSTVFQITQQYQDSNGNVPSSVSLGGTWIDTQPYPGSFLSDQNLQDEVSLATQVNGWTPSLQAAFFVFPVASEPICSDSAGQDCSGSSFCAYHNVFNNNVIYAAMPDLQCGTPTFPNNDPEAENVIDSSSHELMESLTDPLINAWSSDTLGEIGDPCSTSYPDPNPAFNGGDITGNGNFYTVQEEWSNAAGGCALTFP